MFGRKKKRLAIEAINADTAERRVFEPLKRKYTAKIRVYRDRKGTYRWRLVGSNGKIMADSAEGYVSKQNALLAADRLKNIAPEAEIEEI